ncbi:MAG: hypothetical protein NDI77_06255 [Geobacteraceae bacterium]|nr:hypothetical protein [Geobacteraceae bacterium]
MKKYFIIALLLAPFVYGYYHKPQFDQHREKIWVEAKGGDATFDEAAGAQPEWENLYLVDWLVFTATRENKLATLVSFGLLDRVFVLDSEWAPKAFKLQKHNAN